jgi:hypothetical protein
MKENNLPVTEKETWSWEPGVRSRVSRPETSHPDECNEEACLPVGRELVIDYGKQRFGVFLKI